MLLALDVGNTNILAGLYEPGGTLTQTWRLSTQPVGTSDEFRVKISALAQLAGLHFERLKAVAVSSVVPQTAGMLRGAFSDKDFYVIDHSWKYSFSIQASPVEQIGTDRLVNAEAVLREYGAPAVIVDSGTATTICAISPQKQYLGGAIMPGIELSIETLARRTARLFSIELVVPERAIGTNTEEALQSGILLGYASMIDGMVLRFKRELENLGAKNIPVIATGGVSVLLRGVAKELTHFESDLTLKGIRYLYEQNRQLS